MEKRGWALDVPSSEGGHERGSFQGDSEGHHKEAEYGREIHCDATDSGPLLAGHSEAGGEGVTTVVGAGGDRPRDGKRKGGGDNNDRFGVGVGVGGGVRGGVGVGVGGNERIKWGKKIKWRGVDQSGVKNPGGRQAGPEER